jgi:hypothetical protein
MTSFIPNEEQKKCILDITKFIKEYKPYSKLLINGSAGTGKTTIIISTLINILIEQIRNYIKEIELCDDIKSMSEFLKNINEFIITAPTNKAKDVLVNKYNNYIKELTIYSIKETQIINDTQMNDSKYNNDDTIKKQNETLFSKILIIFSKKITFLTVSQLLSISRVINEMGEEEFTKGNEKKIVDKYNKELYSKTSIIVDECSMIDTPTTKLLNIIKCPIIYIGDFCQLPPVNETISPSFEINKLSESNPKIHTVMMSLKIVERCKSDITLIANKLRDKIYNIIPSFNLLSHNIDNVDNVILYNKKFGRWVRTYVKDIKSKQKDLKLIRKTLKLDKTKTNDDIEKDLLIEEKTKEKEDIDTEQQKELFDTMALAWTNKCCNLLNTKIRTHLFEDVEHIESIYIIKGDKLLIKSPYYKYNNHLFSSSIVYVANLKETTYKPLSFREWCNVIVNINNEKTDEKKTVFNIDIDSVLDADVLKLTSDKKQYQNGKSIDDYFKIAEKTDNDNVNDNDNKTEIEKDKDSNSKDDIIKEAKDLLLYRNLFYLHHNLNERLTTNNYVFTDELSLKYNLLIPNYNIYNLSKITSNYVKTSIYIKWHMLMSIKLFGIPNDKIGCKKCSFFLTKFMSQMNTSIYIKDFIDATDKLQFDMVLCDLVSFSSTEKSISKNIPILNMNNEANVETIKQLRTIIKNSYEVKLLLSRNEEKQLNSINKLLNEENEPSSDINDTTSSSKYITLSQLFGHYMSHVITSCYPEVDYGYALTVHKSQGSTYDDVYIDYANILSNSRDAEKLKLLYTAITRSSNKLHLFY